MSKRHLVEFGVEEWTDCVDCGGVGLCHTCNSAGGWLSPKFLTEEQLAEIEAAHACGLDGCLTCVLLAQVRALRTLLL